ncbi:hypothetical protein GF325_05325 [Candidatus Bathyarchaeota archaeon]|nr:hypothetical protein [Candidatus Bathyarchaeota archaeon]
MVNARKGAIKVGIVFRQNKHMITIILAWFVTNFIIMFAQSGSWTRAMKILFYIEDASSAYEKFYSTYSDFVVFGLLIGLITVDAFRNYNPRETCEILARRSRNHVIVFGFTHLGIRLARYLEDHGIPHVVVTRFRDDMKELVQNEKPSLMYDSLDKQFHRRINLRKAKALFLCENDILFNLEIVVMARRMNKDAFIVARCFNDSIAKIFHKYNCKTISTSSATAQLILKDHATDLTNNMHIIGFNHFAERLSYYAALRGIKNTIIEHDIKHSMEMNEYRHLLGEKERELVTINKKNPMNYRNLREAGTLDADIIVITMHESEEVIILAQDLVEMVEGKKIIVRIFSDELEKILEDFGCSVVSTSRYTLETQIKPIFETAKKNKESTGAINKGKKKKNMKGISGQKEGEGKTC